MVTITILFNSKPCISIDNVAQYCEGSDRITIATSDKTKTVYFYHSIEGYRIYR